MSSKYNQALPDVNLVSVPSKGTEVIVNNTKNLHDILIDFYQRDTLTKIFVKSNVELFLSKVRSLEVSSKIEAESLKDDINFYFNELKFLNNLI